MQFDAAVATVNPMLGRTAYGNAVDHDRGAECLENSMRRRLRLFDGTFDEHREFVTTKACNDARFAQRSGEPPGDPDKKLVAGRMAQGVVDRFEVVEIEAQHRNRCGVVTSTGDGLFQSMEEVSPIGQTGQAVAKRFPRDFRQQALVFDEHNELPGEHRGHEDSQRGEHRSVRHLAHRVAQSDRGGQQQRQVRQPQPGTGHDLIPRRRRGGLVDAGQRRQRHHSQSGHSAQVGQIADVIAADPGLEHHRDVGNADRRDSAG